MKKYLLLLTSAALLLAGCAKELVSNGVSSRDRELTKVTFTASLDNGVATKAAVDGDGAAASVNRCIMEIYYGDALFTRQITKVTDKKATFPVQVVSNRTYKVAFWADKVDNADTPEGLAADKYYNTASLKEIAINGAYSGNDDARDAFYHCKDYTVAQAGSSFGGGEDKILLKRPFAQMNVITTDWDIVSAPVAALAPEQVNVIIKNPLVKFNAVTGEASADANTPTLSYTAGVYNAPAPTGTAPANEKTLSMDYLFAPKTEKAFIDIDWKAKKTGDTDVAHAFAAVPYQRNYRTNIKGKLLTTTGQWTVTVDPDWDSQADGSKDYNVVYFAASSIEAANTYIGTQNDGQTKTVDLTNAEIKSTDVDTDGTIHFILKKTSPKDLVSFRLPPIPSTLTGCTGWTIEYEEDYPTKNVEVSAPTGTNVIILAPTSHVVLNGQTYGDIEARTGYGTLVVPQGVTINNLTVKKGWVEIHGTVNTLHQIALAAGDSVYFRDCEGLSQDVFAQIKGAGFNFIHPDYVEKQNGNKWDIIPVAIPVTGVSLSLDKVELNVGKDTSLTATVLPEDASNTSVVWTSSNKAVAIVDHAGKVTAVAAGSAEITVTTVNKSKTATCSVTVIPAGALGGEFSVSDTKTVHFSQGNLWYGPVTEGAPATFNFEANQYDFRTYPGKGSCINGTYNKNSGTLSGHYGLFTCSSKVADAVGNSISGNNLFTNDPNDEEKANSDFKVKVGDIEQSGWRTLSSAEWTYLFNTRSNASNLYKCGVTVCGKTNCVVLLPDDWEWDETADEHNVGTGWQTGGYPETATESNPVAWQTMEDAGAVCLPAAGSCGDSSVYDVGDNGNYWSSTADSSIAYFVNFKSSNVSPGSLVSRTLGCSVRLITDVK